LKFFKICTTGTGEVFFFAMRILGIDPGLNITGYGIIDARDGRVKIVEAGVIRTSCRSSIERRLAKIYLGLCDIIKEHHPSVMILEELYSHYNHPVTSILMGHARGAACLAGARSRVSVVGYSSKRVKKATAGNGNASKLQIARVMQQTFSLRTTPKPADVSDALSLAVAHANILRSAALGLRR
jgi:crossover junction endodeoxyribonuclease RuvC